jgi:asparagine synthase (glutamine-hydrolysing)
MVPRLWRHARRIPGPLRRLGGTPLAALPPRVWNVVGRRPETPEFGRKVQKALRVASRAGSLDEVLASFLDEWSDAASPVVGQTGPTVPTALPHSLAVDDARRLLTYDALTYLPGDVLCKVDRASMAVSLETRVPFLDHRLAGVAARIPVSMNIARGRGKMIVRDILYRHVPKDLVDRPKAGFAVPVGEWLRGPLREWAEDLLASRALAFDGYINATAVREKWEAHVSGRRDATNSLWPVLMFQSWLQSTR